MRVKKGISRIKVKLRSLQVGENGEKTVSEESEINGRDRKSVEKNWKFFISS